MAWSIVSLEGGLSGETGGLVAEATGDAGTTLSSTFEIEPGGVFAGAGLWGIVQRIYIEGQTEGQAVTVSLVIDNTIVVVGTVSTPVGVKQQMELGVQRAGWIGGVRLSADRLTKRIEISAIGMDVYVP